MKHSFCCLFYVSCFIRFYSRKHVFKPNISVFRSCMQQIQKYETRIQRCIFHIYFKFAIEKILTYK
jgi:hypothetical protein